MERRRSLGLSLVSLTSIIFFGYSFLFFIFFLPSRGNPWFVMLRYILCLIVSFLGFIASIFVFDIRRWARKLIFYSCLFFLGLAIVMDTTFLIISRWFGVPSLFALLDTVFTAKKLSLYTFWFILMIFLRNPNYSLTLHSLRQCHPKI